LSYLVAKHSVQTISGVLLLSTRPETGTGGFLALLIVMYSAADLRRQIAPGFLLVFTHVQAVHRAAAFDHEAGSVPVLPCSQVAMRRSNMRQPAALSNWVSYQVTGDAR